MNNQKRNAQTVTETMHGEPTNQLKNSTKTGVKQGERKGLRANPEDLMFHSEGCELKRKYPDAVLKTFRTLLPYGAKGADYWPALEAFNAAKEGRSVVR